MGAALENIMQIWMRLGDADAYAPYDSVEDVAEGLVWCGLSGFSISRAGEYGVAIPDAGYSGKNYVSLFWGDNDAQPIRGLTDAELDALRLLSAVADVA